ncbi:hypothetical protein ACQVA2_12285 [Citrobacter sp. OP27]
MITLKEQVKQLIHSQPITLRREIISQLHVPSKTLTHYLHQLVRDGEVVLYRGRGYFKDDSAYDIWHADNRRRFGAKTGAVLRSRTCKQSSGENAIFNECRQSVAMQRVLSVYGRASA